jgi:CheY-like chemotaxis protein
LEATRQIRINEGDGPHVPIVALTANAFAEDREACLAAGMDGFVSKPIRREDLFDAIASALRAR